tara:strand:+ start:377 stop:2398 length:2022 start_codon:yes stop_codon:yes gene_type:complete
MGDVYEEQNRYDQFLQQALNQGNADESMDLSYYNMNLQAKESEAQNKTINEELVFTTLPSVIPHMLEIYQRAKGIYDTVQDIKARGETIAKNLKTLPEDAKAYYKSKIDEIQGHLKENTAKSYNLAREKYNQLKEDGKNIGTKVLDKVDELKTTGADIVNKAKSAGGAVIEQGIKIKQFVTEQSSVADKRNVLLDRATTPERRADIESKSDEEIHTLFGKLPAGQYSLVEPSAGTSLLDQAKATAGAVLEQAKTSAGGAVGEKLSDIESYMKNKINVNENSSISSKRTLLTNLENTPEAKTQMASKSDEEIQSLFKQLPAGKGYSINNQKRVAQPDIELKDMTSSRQVFNPLFEGNTSAPYATQELYPQKVRVGFGEVPSYKGSQTGELGSSVPVLPTTKQAVPKNPSPEAEAEVEPVSSGITVGSVLGGAMKVAGVAGGIAGDVQLIEDKNLTPLEKAQLGINNAPLVEAASEGVSKIASMVGSDSSVLPAISTGLGHLGQAAGIGGAILGDVELGEHGGTTSQKVQTALNNVPAVQSIYEVGSKVQGALTQTAEQAASKATELAQTTASLAPKVEEAVATTAKVVGEGVDTAIATGTEAVASGASALGAIGEGLAISSVSEAIPVVGQIVGLGTLLWGAITGLEGLFGHHDAPPPPPQAIQQSSIVHQAGI